MTKRIFLLVAISLITIRSYGQDVTPEALGYRHISINFNGDPVDMLVKSGTGDGVKKKPVLFFCQGSLPQPLIKYYDGGAYGVFPFDTDILSEYFHLVIVGKPYIPVSCHVDKLGKNRTCLDARGKYPAEYSERNLLSYYAARNAEVIKYLRGQDWVAGGMLIIAGHSEGSTVAAKTATISPYVTHLIYSGGNPSGRMSTLVRQGRATESEQNSSGESEIAYWKHVMENPMDMDDSHGDTNRAAYEFSYPSPVTYLEELKIPVLISYGSEDWGAPFVDNFRLDVIRSGKKNFTFLPYIGAEHNYFPLLENGLPDYNVFGWDKVAEDWKEWLEGYLTK